MIRTYFQARRRTGTPEDFLRPALKLQGASESEGTTKTVAREPDKLTGALSRKVSDTPEVNQALMQKLLEIDKALKQKEKEKGDIDSKLMPPPTSTRGISSSSQNTNTNTETRARSLQHSIVDPKFDRKARSNSFGSTGSLNEAGNVPNGPLPASFQRGNRVSKSARTYVAKVDHGQKLPSSARGSPNTLRKQHSADGEKGSRPSSQYVICYSVLYLFHSFF